MLCQALLLPMEVEWLGGFADFRAGAAQMLAELVAAADMDSYRRVALDGLIAEFMYSAGYCEAILRQPIPYAYTRSMLPCCCVHLFCALLTTASPSAFPVYCESCSEQ